MRGEQTAFPVSLTSTKVCKAASPLASGHVVGVREELLLWAQGHLGEGIGVLQVSLYSLYWRMLMMRAPPVVCWDLLVLAYDSGLLCFYELDDFMLVD